MIHEGDRPLIFVTVKCSSSRLPCGAHVTIRQLDPTANRYIARPYTPTKFTSNVCEICFRVYPDGQLSPLLGKLEVGDKLEMMGPVGGHRYIPSTSTFEHGAKSWKNVTNIAMICGGTGLTPMLQIINAVLQIPRQTRLKRGLSVKLNYFCSEVDEVIMERELREFERVSEGGVTVRIIISSDKFKNDPKYREKYSFKSMRNLDGEGIFDLLGTDKGFEHEDLMICMCGPKPFVAKAKRELSAIGVVNNVLVW